MGHSSKAPRSDLRDPEPGNRLPSPPSKDRLTGNVNKWMPEKGFGFIHGVDGQEYFFHRTSVKHPDDLEVGTPVTYVAVHSPKGLRAEQVEFL